MIDITKIRDALRKSDDRDLVPLGHNLTDDQIRTLVRYFREAAQEFGD